MISAIACVDNNWGIGNKGELLSHIPDDMKFFKKKTLYNTVIMGRKTYESIGKPLPKRVNLVLTEKADSPYKKNDVVFCNIDFIKRFIQNVQEADIDSIINIFVMGGGQTYKTLLPYCSKAYITKVFNDYNEVDTYFPNLDELPEWCQTSTSEIKTYKDIKYQFCVYDRKDI